MILPTLNWLINQSALANLKCVTSAGSLDKTISSVNVLDNPDVVKWIKRDELVLTTGFFFVNEPEVQAKVLRDLKETDCAALCIKVKQYLYNIPQSMIDEAERLGLVLIEMPFFFPFSEISRLVYNQIYQMNLSDRHLQGQKMDAIMDMCFEGAGLDKIVYELSGAFAVSLLVTNSHRECIAMGLVPEDSYLFTMEDTVVIEPDHFASNKKTYVHEDDHTLYAQAVSINGFSLPCLVKDLPQHSGHLLMLLKTGEEPGRHTELMDKAARIVALTLKSGPKSLISPRMYFDLFFDFLQRDDEMRPEEVMRACNLYGFNYALKRVCAVFMPHGSTRETQHSHTMRVLRSEMKEIFDRQLIIYFCYNIEMVVVFFQYHVDEPNAKCVNNTVEYVTKALEKIRPGFQCAVSVGISRCQVGPDTIRSCYADSQKSIAIGMKLGPAEGVYVYRHIFPYALLSDMSREQVIKLYHDTVRPLAEYDRENGTDLVSTLAALLENRHNVVATAKQLFLHRNTLAGRIEKIKRILELDLDNYNECIQLSLGLYAHSLISAENSGERYALGFGPTPV